MYISMKCLNLGLVGYVYSYWRICLHQSEQFYFKWFILKKDYQTFWLLYSNLHQWYSMVHTVHSYLYIILIQIHTYMHACTVCMHTKQTRLKKMCTHISGKICSHMLVIVRMVVSVFVFVINVYWAFPFVF